MTSPRARPALWARPPSSTSSTSTPRDSSTPSCWAIAGVSERAAIPSLVAAGSALAACWSLSSSRATFTASVTCLPSRMTSTGTSRPTGVSATARGRSLARPTGRPS